MEVILDGKLSWSRAVEVIDRNKTNDIAHQFSGIMPYCNHFGTITLTGTVITVSGDDDLQIPLSHIVQLYLGFDNVYTPALTKNFGLFWKPLRIKLSNDEVYYFIIDYNFISAKNKKWFKVLKDLLQ